MTKLFSDGNEFVGFRGIDFIGRRKNIPQIVAAPHTKRDCVTNCKTFFQGNMGEQFGTFGV
jgi:hypothetical protein